MQYITDDTKLATNGNEVVVTNERAYGPVRLYLPDTKVATRVVVHQSGKHAVYVVCEPHTLARFGRLYSSARLPGRGSMSTFTFDTEAKIWTATSSFPVSVTNIAEAVLFEHEKKMLAT